MIEYGAGPTSTDIEVTLFGPGYGEAIAVHLGDGIWILVDSCIDPERNAPASASYLDAIAVDPGKIHTIVASHWHDDHVRGIAMLASKYINAQFVLSGLFNNKEASAFLAAYSGSSSAGLSSGTKELFEVIREREVVHPVFSRSIVFEGTLDDGRDVRVTALSPLPAAFSQFLANLACHLAQKDDPINRTPELRPNTGAVALHVDLGDDAVILGADLEEHASMGWSAIIADPWASKQTPATAYKVAHHGSHTGECPDLWRTLLTPGPIACLTPFSLGRHRLPTDADKRRIKEKTSDAYLSSGASRRPEIDRAHLKRLEDICKNIARVNNGFGAVRLRKRKDLKEWRVELFGQAQTL